VFVLLLFTPWPLKAQRQDLKDNRSTFLIHFRNFYSLGAAFTVFGKAEVKVLISPYISLQPSFQTFIILPNRPPIRVPRRPSYTVEKVIMPIVFSSPGASATSEKVLWIDDYVSRADSGLLTPTTQSFGFKTYIPSSAKALLYLDPIDYLSAYRDQLANSQSSGLPQSPTRLQGPAKLESGSLIRKVLGMAGSVSMPAPTISITTPATNAHSVPEHSALTTRKSASLHKNLMTKLRPLPFQYVWTVFYDKSAPSSTSNPSNQTKTTTTTSSTPSAKYNTRLTTLSPSVPDIAEFYKIFNNIPWPSIPSRSSIHIFRSGVQPLWEDPENLDGGCWTLKVRKSAAEPDRPQRVWEEICLMGCGGELQAALVESGSRDHVLGMTFCPRGFWVCVSVWLKKGDGRHVVERTVLERLSAQLRPSGEGEYYWKSHCEHEGWEEAVGRLRQKKEE
jgi:Eukaryotic initiation factor 4E